MIKIKVNSKKGVNINSYIDSYFASFTSAGWPYFLGGDSAYEGSQILLLDELANKPSKTKALILDGKDFFYYYTGHSLSGTLNSVKLSTLGNSYNADDGSFDTKKNGEIKGAKTTVTISGLNIHNDEGEEGELHDVVYALMGNSSGTAGADAGPLLAIVNGEAQKVIGSKGNDTYSGTPFNDIVKGKNGNDTLRGNAGQDQIDGGKGNDKIFGGEDADSLKGSKGKDAFVFDTALDAVDIIQDFKPKDDTIWLDDAVFTSLGTGKLTKNAFVKGSAAKDANDRVGYDPKSGNVWYDADGAGGDNGVTFVKLDKKLDVDADDFLII